MKKKLKTITILLASIVLCVAIYFVYLFKFKEYDVADDAVDEIVENPYTIEMPDGKIVVIDEDGELVELDEAASNGVNNGTDAESTSTGNKDDSTKDIVGDKVAGTTTVPKNQTVAEIKADYTPTFASLETQANSKINTLVNHAKQEYSSKKKSGESISYSYFYNKYVGATTELEKTTDAFFYGTVKAIEKDFEANGHNKSEAQSFIKEYEAMKKERKKALLKKALNQ